MSEDLSYLKVVDPDCQMCDYWVRGNHCNFPGKLRIKNGVCFGMKARESPITVKNPVETATLS